MNRIKTLLSRYKELVLYVVFGAFTTLINIVSYHIFRRWMGIGLVAADVLAWVLSVLFAYITNKLFVFESRSWRMQVVLREASEFFAARVVSLGVDVAFLYLTVECLHWWEMPMKIAANVVVIVINYIFSKWIIFKKDSAAKQQKEEGYDS
ncbi:MAG: GtrA family protein [Lachnospiraceae bacterium]|jgi:putative flippase GtrA|nr:GtrA family protein [Lachnospiraceae bacterium]